MAPRKIPDQIWKSMCEDARHPMVIIDASSNKFLWVNSAYEHLTGYGEAELLAKTWIDITDQGSVGGDLACVKSIIDNKSNQYEMDKEYVHKKGHTIPVTIVVRKYPENDDVLLFRVEAIVSTATQLELNTTKIDLLGRIDNLSQKLQELSNNNSGKFFPQNTDHAKFKYMFFGFTVFASLMMYVFYCLVMFGLHKEPVSPPNTPSVKYEVQK